jgi:hypothetical protein
MCHDGGDEKESKLKKVEPKRLLHRLDVGQGEKREELRITTELFTLAFQSNYMLRWGNSRSLLFLSLKGKIRSSV